jgi:hypothetical protein
MNNRKLRKSLMAGTVSGIFLGLILKAVEFLTDLKVYTLLLNVDYIPILNQVSLHESIEFGIHLVISIFLSLFLALFLTKQSWRPKTKFLFVFYISILIGMLLYPTTTLSPRTPALTNFAAISYWMVGHAMYGGILAVLLKNKLF